MESQLQSTLERHVQSDWQSNPATHQIITGYATYHAVLAAAAGLTVLVLAWLSVRFWMKFAKSPKIRRLHWPFEKKVYFCFASLCTLLVMFFGLVGAANISTAAKPLPGFSGSISSLTDTAYNAELHKAFNTWIISGKATPPTLVQQRIHNRRVFHTTRVIVGVILLVTLTAMGMRIWKTLLAHRTATSEKWTAKELLWLVAGMVTVALAIYALVFVLANLQSAIVPVANTLQFG